MNDLKCFLIIVLSLLSMQVWGKDCSSSNIRLSTQDDVDNFQANYGLCDRVTGYLQVSGNTITNIDGLVDLTSVMGGLTISNSALTDLSGLANLTSIGGDLYIVQNPTLAYFDGLANLTSVGGYLYIVQNPTLTDIDGLVSLSSVGDYIDIWNNTALTNLDGLSNLASVGDSIDIRSNPALTNLNGLVNITSLPGHLYIFGNALTNLSGLDNLTSVGGYLHIFNTRSLTNLDGLTNLSNVGSWVTIESNFSLTNLNGLANLTSLGGWLRIRYNWSLNNVDGLANLTSISGDLSIDNNTHLTNLNGLVYLNSVGDYLFIGNNGNLGDCSALAPLLGWPDGPPSDNVDGVIDVWTNNATGCKSVQEILDSVSGPTAPSIISANVTSGQVDLDFSPADTTDVLWPVVTGYHAQCLSENFVFENNTVVDIPDLDSAVSNLTLFGVPFQNATALNVAVNITHPRTRHLALTLKSPSGTSAKLWDEAVGDGENLVGTFPTTLVPAESLEAFDGLNFNGEWQLTVADGIASHTGTLNSWGITIRDKVTAMSQVSPITLTGLTDYQAYSCTVSAVTGLGIGPASNTVLVTPRTPELIYSDGFEDN